MTTARHSGRRPVWAGLLLFLALVSICTAASVARGARMPETILPGVRVAGVPVGGMSASDAARLLRERLRYQVERPIHVVWESGDHFLLPSDVGIAADVDSMVEDALAVARSGNAFVRIWSRCRLAVGGVSLPLRVHGDERLDRVLQSLRRRIEKPPTDAGFDLRADSQVTLVPSRPGLEVDMPAFRKQVLATTQEIDREVIVPVRVVLPTVTTSQARSWGIHQAVTVFDTRFDTRDANRSHNLYLAAKALDGAVLAPGQTFSFNKRVGPRLPQYGYKSAPVVKDGELVPDIGGGVCQVSSTLYNAVLLAGLYIDFRRPHSIPAVYVPLGRDATVAYDYIDLRFTNTTPDHLYIKAWVSGGRLKVALLGKSQATPARLVSKVEEVKPMPVQEIVDPNLPAGKKVVERKGGKGYTVSVWRVQGSKANESWEFIGRSTYKPRVQLTRVGAGLTRAAAQTGSVPASESPTPGPQG